MSVLLTRRAVLQGAIETVYNSPAAVGPSDGFLISNPAFTIKPNVLERNFVRDDLSQMPFIVGRKLASMEFETELRGNGLQGSGRVSDAAMITRLFRASGYKLTPSRGPVVKGPFDQGNPSTLVSWAVSSGSKASQTLTMSDTPSNGQTITVGNKTYKWVTAASAADGDVLIGVGSMSAISNLIAAINLAPGAGAAYASATTAQPDKLVASSGGPGVLVVTAPHVGAYFNLLPTTTTTSQGQWGGATLTGGVGIASNTDTIAYYLTVDTAGASGAAKVTVTSDTAGEGSASAVVTSGSPISLGTKGLTITPTWTGNLAQGQAWTLWLLPAGLSLDPISDNFESITLYMHKDGVLHEMPGSFGTFEITAQAGDFATIKWTFTGTYVEPVDDPNPSPIFERTLPSQVELARLRVGSFPAVVEKFTFNQMNDIQIRPDVGSSDGYIGTRIVSRKPEGGINPEADLVANNDFWGQLAAAQEMPLQLRVGHVPGNTVWMLFPNTQYSGLTYTDRNGILAYDAGVRFARSLGNDEATFYFC
jgi:hypothetical protein